MDYRWDTKGIAAVQTAPATISFLPVVMRARIPHTVIVKVSDIHERIEYLYEQGHTDLKKYSCYVPKAWMIDLDRMPIFVEQDGQCLYSILTPFGEVLVERVNGEHGFILVRP